METKTRIETVKIVSPVSIENPHGYIVINKSDLTPAHVVFGEVVKRGPGRPPYKNVVKV